MLAQHDCMIELERQPEHQVLQITILTNTYTCIPRAARTTIAPPMPTYKEGGDDADDDTRPCGHYCDTRSILGHLTEEHCTQDDCPPDTHYSGPSVNNRRGARRQGQPFHTTSLLLLFLYTLEMARCSMCAAA
jgi:hypothetical protein